MGFEHSSMGGAWVQCMEWRQGCFCSDIAHCHNWPVWSAQGGEHSNSYSECTFLD
jgi:hypothetical protein